MVKHDVDRARQLVKESEYDGRPVVVLHPSAPAFINAAVIVTRRRLESIGFNVILKPMDWSTNTAVRARKEPPDKGGWNIVHTWWVAADVISPAVHFGVSGRGGELVRLARGSAAGEAHHRLGARHGSDQAQAVGGRDPKARAGRGDVRAVGRVVPADVRRNVNGILKFAAPVFWNVKIT